MKQNYLFETDSFGFRPVTETDIDYLVMLATDPEIMRFFPNGALSLQEVKAKAAKYRAEFDAKKYGIFLVFDIKTNEFIGRAGFGDAENGEIEVGYVLLKKYWGKGYATKWVKILLAWAKNNIQRDKIIAYAPVAHLASERVMQKAGMTYAKKSIMQGIECVIYEYKLI